MEAPPDHANKNGEDGREKQTRIVSVLFNMKSIDRRDEMEKKWQDTYRSVIVPTKAQGTSQQIALITNEMGKNVKHTTGGLLYGYLTEINPEPINAAGTSLSDDAPAPQDGDNYLDILIKTTNDGYKQLFSGLRWVVHEKYHILKIVYRRRLLQLIEQVYKKSDEGQRVIMDLFRYCRHREEESDWLVSRIMKMVSEVKWTTKYESLTTRSVYMLLRLLPSQRQNVSCNALVEKELKYLEILLKDRLVNKGLGLAIGRDLIRVWLRAAKHFDRLKAIYDNTFENGKNSPLLHSILEKPTSKNCLIDAMAPETENHIFFMMTHLKMGHQPLYEKIFFERHLNFKGGQELIVDIIRFLCVVCHIQNDRKVFVHRWPFVGWLLNAMKSQYSHGDTAYEKEVVKLAQQSLMFDWVCFQKKDSVQNLCTAMYLIHYSIPKFVGTSNELLDMIYKWTSPDVTTNRFNLSAHFVATNISNAVRLLFAQNIGALPHIMQCNLIPNVLRDRLRDLATGSLHWFNNNDGDKTPNKQPPPQTTTPTPPEKDATPPQKPIPEQLQPQPQPPQPLPQIPAVPIAPQQPVVTPMPEEIVPEESKNDMMVDETPSMEDLVKNREANFHAHLQETIEKSKLAGKRSKLTALYGELIQTLISNISQAYENPLKRNMRAYSQAVEALRKLIKNFIATSPDEEARTDMANFLILVMSMEWGPSYDYEQQLHHLVVTLNQTLFNVFVVDIHKKIALKAMDGVEAKKSFAALLRAMDTIEPSLGYRLFFYSLRRRPAYYKPLHHLIATQLNDDLLTQRDTLAVLFHKDEGFSTAELRKQLTFYEWTLKTRCPTLQTKKVDVLLKDLQAAGEQPLPFLILVYMTQQYLAKDYFDKDDTARTQFLRVICENVPPTLRDTLFSLIRSGTLSLFTQEECLAPHPILVHLFKEDLDYFAKEVLGDIYMATLEYYAPHLPKKSNQHELMFEILPYIPKQLCMHVFCSHTSLITITQDLVQSLLFLPIQHYGRFPIDFLQQLMHRPKGSRMVTEAVDGFIEDLITFDTAQVQIALFHIADAVRAGATAFARAELRELLEPLTKDKKLPSFITHQMLPLMMAQLPKSSNIMITSAGDVKVDTERVTKRSRKKNQADSPDSDDSVESSGSDDYSSSASSDEEGSEEEDQDDDDEMEDDDDDDDEEEEENRPRRTRSSRRTSTRGTTKKKESDRARRASKRKRNTSDDSDDHEGTTRRTRKLKMKKK